MNSLIARYTTATPGRDLSYSRLVEEIAYLEARLIAIGQTGDCAYEKSMARSYRELLSHRRCDLMMLNGFSATDGSAHRATQSPAIPPPSL